MGDAVVGIRLVDGLGRVHDLRAEDGDLFDAVGVSLGLCGVVTGVSFRCIPRFDLMGEEAPCSMARAGVSLVEGQEGRMAAFLEEAEYARVMWWPMPGLEGCVVWRARKMSEADYATRRDPETGQLLRQPYEELPLVLGSTVPVQAAAGGYLWLVGQWPHWFYRILGRSRPVRALESWIHRGWRRWLKGRAYGVFVGGSPDEPQHFHDTWWQGLSMDDQVDPRLLPTGFTELWVPMSRADEAMALLREHFATGHEAAGKFVTEIYCGKQSRFWLSPAYGEDQLRINVFWFKGNAGDPVKGFYKAFWDLMEPLGYRLHWTKTTPPAEDLGPDWFRSRYPRFDDFMEVRDSLDPDQLFVTEYWRSRLGIPRPAPRLVEVEAEPDLPVLQEPRPEARQVPRPWPLLFSLDPVESSLEGLATHCFDNRMVWRLPSSGPGRWPPSPWTALGGSPSSEASTGSPSPLAERAPPPSRPSPS